MKPIFIYKRYVYVVVVHRSVCLRDYRNGLRQHKRNSIVGICFVYLDGTYAAAPCELSV